MIGADVEIAEVHQRVRDGVLIAFRTLDCEYFPIAGFCAIQVARECADIAEIAERIGEGAMILGQAIICDCLFVGGSGLRQLAAMKKNARAMFMIVRHESALVRRREVCYGALTDGSHELQRCGREYIYHCCDGPVCMPCPHCGHDESDPEPAAVSEQRSANPNYTQNLTQHF